MSREEDRGWPARATRGVGFALAATLVTTLAFAQEEVRITWRGGECAPQALMETTPSAAAAVQEWSSYAESTGSRFVLSDDARVLLLVSETFQALGRNKEHREVELMLELVAQTTEVLDRVLPPVASEDHTAVVVCVQREHYPRLLANMATIDERLRAWAGGAGRLAAGFSMSEPLVGAWVEDPENVDEWNPHNELVHRTAQVLIRQRAPHLPDWLLLGLTWHVEDTVRGSIYCFPHRTGFVSALSHTDWGRWLTNEFKRSRRKMRDKPLTLQVEEFATWRPHRDGFDEERAYLAFGVARYLVGEHGAQVPRLITGLSDAVEKGRKVWLSETEWTTDPEFQLPIGDQLAALEGIHPGFLEGATRFFQKNGASKRILPKTRKRRR